MINLRIWLLVLLIGLTTGLVSWRFFHPLTALPVWASENCELISCNKDTQSEDECLSCNERKQTCWEEKIRETQNASSSLTNTISILNGQIQVQELQVEQTKTEIRKLEGEIGDLTQRISGLNVSLDRLSTVLVKRMPSTI